MSERIVSKNQLRTAQIRRTHQFRDEIEDVVADRLAQGIGPTEYHELFHDTLVRLDTYIWPSLAAEIVTDARRYTPEAG